MSTVSGVLFLFGFRFCHKLFSFEEEGEEMQSSDYLIRIAIDSDVCKIVSLTELGSLLLMSYVVAKELEFYIQKKYIQPLLLPLVNFGADEFINVFVFYF